MSSTTHLMTADELIKLPRGQYRYELVKGELLTLSLSGAEHSAITVNLTAALASYVKAHKLGIVFGAETGFKLESNPDTVLAPDIGFIKKDRINSPPKGYLEIAPDLAVEVISPGEQKSKVAKKALQWLAFGVTSLWLVRPENRTVETVTHDAQKTCFSETDMLSDAVVPGFRILVSEIFK